MLVMKSVFLNIHQEEIRFRYSKLLTLPVKKTVTEPVFYNSVKTFKICICSIFIETLFGVLL
jgi:hypothetical protein